MHTTFIAVQCFQCSTMQVKQQKKSSNKWSCVVCNQKQSVRKVFAQSAMARDVRKFVQNFNMSRQLSDQKQSLSEETEIFESQRDGREKKRNDWSEYVDDQEDYRGQFGKDEDSKEGDNGSEPMVVTEIPKALFKKPKIKNSSSNGHDGSEKMFKPTFPDRRNAQRRRNEISGDIHLNRIEHTSCGKAANKSDSSDEKHTSLHPSDRAPKWNRFRAQIQENNWDSTETEKPFVRQLTRGVKGSVSKWSDHITRGDESIDAVGRSLHTTASKGPLSKWSSFITEVEEEEDDDNERFRATDSSGRLEKLMNDERVEDDIHPDFI